MISTQWDLALWKAVAFDDDPACLFLAFLNGPAGDAIFLNLFQSFGPIDRFNEIRVSIIEGDIPGLHPGYSVTIGPNLEGMAARAQAEQRAFDPDRVPPAYRVLRMNPDQGSSSLYKFKQALASDPRYILSCGSISEDFSRFEPTGLPIGKAHILFRNVSDIISVDDVDRVVFPILHELDPIH